MSSVTPLMLYIATRFSDGPGLAEPLATHLESLGHTCTYRWWLTEESPDYTSADWRRISDADLKGVADADVVIVLMTTGRQGCGMWVELGYALALGKPVILWAPPEHTASLDPSKLEETCPFFYAQGVVRIKSSDSMLQQEIRERIEAMSAAWKPAFDEGAHYGLNFETNPRSRYSGGGA